MRDFFALFKQRRFVPSSRARLVGVFNNGVFKNTAIILTVSHVGATGARSRHPCILVTPKVLGLFKEARRETEFEVGDIRASRFQVAFPVIS